jgi:DNA-binding GntR family transcriptional regulator
MANQDRTQTTYEAIVTRLLRRELNPGEHLLETQFAEELGCSRTPLREALRILVTQGILIEHRHRGRFVPKRTPEEVVQLGEARQAVEGMMAAIWAERAQPEQVAYLRELADTTHTVAVRGAVRPYYETDYQFHLTLVRQCPNSYLAQHTNAEALILNTFINMPYRDQIPLRERGEGHSLGDIVTAIERRDPAGAEQAARAHLSYLAVRALRVQEEGEAVRDALSSGDQVADERDRAVR